MGDYLELAGRGRTDWWRYPLTTLAALGLWLVLMTAILFALEQARLMPADITSELIQPTHVAVFYGATGGLFGLLLASFALVIRVLHAKSFADIVGRWSWRRWAIAFGVWLAICVVSAVVDYLIEPGGFSRTLGPATLALALWSTPSLAIQTFTEEFIFRGYVTQGLLLATRRPLATAILSGLAFAALHIPNGWPQAASAAAFGVITALIAIRTGGLAVTWGLHFANNLFGAIVIVSADDVFRGSPAVFTQATPNLMWLDAVVPFVALVVVLRLYGWPLRPSPRPS